MDKCDTPPDVGGKASRREFLGEFGMALAGSILPLAEVLALMPPAARAAAASASGSPEPGTANAYAASDVRHYGVMPNRPAAAAMNTTALAALVSPTGSFSGNLTFPNTTGNDVYHFNDTIPFHDGIHIDLMNSTLSFSKIGVARDTNAGFLHAIRDFSIESGSIVVDYTHKAGSNTGNALSFGGRGDDCSLFPNIYDSMLASSMGKIVVRNVRISSNAGGGEGRGILMLGGLDGVLLENVTIDGQGQLLDGVYYEFGWATNDPKLYLRQTSHAHNFLIKNLTVTGVISEGFAANGAYGATIDGIKVSNSGGVCAFGPGESLFFRPWSGVGDRKSKPSISIRNAVGESIKNVGISVTGASKLSSSFLDDPPKHDNPNNLAAVHQTDLLDFTLDTFSITGTANNYGVSTSAGRAVIRNGTLKGFQRGVVTTQECTKFIVDNLNILDSTGLGIQIGQAQSIHNPPRLASGIIRRCFVAGSGASGSSAAIALATTLSCVIENCRFGYDQSNDKKSERTQSQAVTVSADASEVVCRDNYVGGTADNSVAYVLTSTAAGGRQCRLVDNRGIVTSTGAWLGNPQDQAVQRIANRSTIMTAAVHSVWVTAPSAVTDVSVQAGTQHGQTIVIIHEGPATNSIAFGSERASNVANGAPAIAGLTSRILAWNDESKLWYSFG
jgi:hypothetical protein